MPQTSPVNTATAAGAAAIITPVVSQIAAALHLQLTPDVLAAIVVVLVAGAHWVGQQMAAVGQLVSRYIAVKEAALAAPALIAPTLAPAAPVAVKVAVAAPVVPAVPVVPIPASAQQ